MNWKNDVVIYEFLLAVQAEGAHLPPTTDSEIPSQVKWAKVRERLERKPVVGIPPSASTLQRHFRKLRADHYPQVDSNSATKMTRSAQLLDQLLRQQKAASLPISEAPVIDTQPKSSRNWTTSDDDQLVCAILQLIRSAKIHQSSMPPEKRDTRWIAVHQAVAKVLPTIAAVQPASSLRTQYDTYMQAVASRWSGTAAPRYMTKRDQLACQMLYEGTGSKNYMIMWRERKAFTDVNREQAREKRSQSLSQAASISKPEAQDDGGNMVAHHAVLPSQPHPTDHNTDRLATLVNDVLPLVPEPTHQPSAASSPQAKKRKHSHVAQAAHHHMQYTDELADYLAKKQLRILGNVATLQLQKDIKLAELDIERVKLQQLQLVEGGKVLALQAACTTK